MEQPFKTQQSNNQQFKSLSALFIPQKVLLEPSAVENHQSLTIDVIQKKSPFEQMKLNLSNPGDRALTLAIKMMQHQKTRQQRQKKMIDQIRLHQQSKSFQIGQISRMIVNQQFLGKHQYLRQNLYKSDRYRIKVSYENPQKNSKLTSRKKQIIKKQIQILQRSKLFSKKNECKKIVKDIFYDLIYKTVELIQKKKSFIMNSLKKVNICLKNDYRPKNYKPQLSMSRVMDIKISNEQQKQQDQQEQQSEQQQDDDDEQDHDQEQDEGSENNDQSEDEQQKSEQEKGSDGNEEEKQQKMSQNDQEQQ